MLDVNRIFIHQLCAEVMHEKGAREVFRCWKLSYLASEVVMNMIIYDVGVREWILAVFVHSRLSIDCATPIIGVG